MQPYRPWQVTLSPAIFLCLLLCINPAIAENLNQIETTISAAGLINIKEKFAISRSDKQVYLELQTDINAFGVGTNENRQWMISAPGCNSPMINQEYPGPGTTYRYHVEACSTGVVCENNRAWISVEARSRVFMHPTGVGGFDRTIRDQEIFGKPGQRYDLGAC